MRQAAAEAWKYCDPENYDLKQALAAHHRVSPDNIVVGEGIDGLFGYLVRMFVEPGVTVATSLGAYPTFNFHVTGFGGRLVTVPYRADREDPAALAVLAASERARLIYFANPDNPMGTWWDAATVRKLIEDVPAGAVLCLDEAYIDFAPEGTAPPLDPADPRVIRFRTFSKAHGMAGARVGYAIGEAELIKRFDAIRNHFGVNRVAQEGAYASLGDPEFIAGVVRAVTAGRRDYEALAGELGLKTLPSMTNFVAIDLATAERATTAMRRLLEDEAVFVRMPGVAPLNRCIRVTVGTPDQRRAFADAFRRVVARL